MPDATAPKRTTTPARAAASRANGRKSAGPATDAGKARSRANAYKHGLAGEGVVLPPEVAAEVAAKVESYTRALNPRDDPQRDLVRAAAHAAWKAQQCQARDLAATRLRLARATLDDGTRRAAAHAAAPDRYADDPTTALAELARTVAGLDWMIDQWRDLRAELVEQGYWGAQGEYRATRLLKHGPLADYRWEARGSDVHAALHAAQPGTPLSRLVGMLPRDHPTRVHYQQQWADAPPQEDPAERRRGQEFVLRACDHYIAGLEALRDRVAPLEELERGLAVDLARAGDDPAERLRARYDDMARRAWHSSLVRLQALQSRPPAPNDPEAPASPPPTPDPPDAPRPARNEPENAPLVSRASRDQPERTQGIGFPLGQVSTCLPNFKGRFQPASPTSKAGFNLPYGKKTRLAKLA